MYKKYTFLLTILFSSFIINTAFSQKFSYPENLEKDGLHMISSKSNSIKLEFNIAEFELTSRELNGEIVNDIHYGLNLIPGEAGTPNLPFISHNFLIPNDAIATLVINDFVEENIPNIDISPSSRIPFDSEESITEEKGEQYLVNAVFPQNPIEIRQTEIRGMNYVQVAISPFQFNPVTKELTISKNMSFEIQWETGKSQYGEERLRSPYWDPIISDLTFNREAIPEVDYSKRQTSSKQEGCEYLIITLDNEDFQIWADTIKKFRNEQGIHTKVMTVSEVGGNEVQVIDDFFEEVYDTWDPVPAAVLIMADYGEEDDGITAIRYDHPYEDTFITDNNYADIDGNNLPDFVFARITGRDYDELELLVNKFLNYERTPPTAENFYNEPITALGWQTERWFQICSETIGGYMSNNLGKSPVRINAIYEGNPDVDPWSTANNTSNVLNYFGVNGLNYIPESPSDLGDWSGGTANDVVNAINSGCFVLQHRDHGFYSGWGEPAFRTNHIPQLTNIDQLTHVFSINCQTGQFDAGENCFAEKFHRHANGGAVSVTAPTQVSYSFVNDALVWGIYDNMWPDFMPDYGGSQIPERDFRPAFGLASGKYFLSSTNWASSVMKTITYRLFHHHGDAFGNIYTEVPVENTVVHDPGITSDLSSIEIMAESGSLIGLSADGEFLASGIVEDGSINLDFPQQVPGTQIKVVATKQNYFRHESYILVIPTEGPYVMKTTYTLNDENGNGEVDYNETISLDVVVKNVGLEDATNVTISLNLNDEYVEILNGSYEIASLEGGQEMLIEDVFSFKTAVEIPDLHALNFEFAASDNNDTWTSDILLTAYAPYLVHSVIGFNEIDGNGNNYLDPGETVIASFSSLNMGHREFPAGQSMISESSSFININSSSFSFDAIQPESSLITEFELTADASTPYASIASILNTIEADPFEIEQEMYFTIGLIVEDWETESTSEFSWLLNGNQNWFITDDYTAEGDFALKSGDIIDNESSELMIEYNVLADHEISFFMQISSEEDHDFLHFYIDDQLIQSWSGLVIYEQFTFPVQEGVHVFKWVYTKDEEGNGGLDASWLDYIIFPPGNTITGLEENNSMQSNIQVYPNPANDLLFINSIEVLEYKLFNQFGQLVQIGNATGNTIDISKISKGNYILQLTNDKGINNVTSIIKM